MYCIQYTPMHLYTYTCMYFTESRAETKNERIFRDALLEPLRIKYTYNVNSAMAIVMEEYFDDSEKEETVELFEKNASVMCSVQASLLWYVPNRVVRLSRNYGKHQYHRFR